MKVFICDYNAADRHVWVLQLHKIEATCGIALEITEYASAEKLLFQIEDKKNRPDLILLEENLPEMDGITVAERIRQMNLKTEIIFLTANPNHWSEAFDVEALHYLIKGQVEPVRLQQVIMKAVNKIDARKEINFSFSCAGVTEIVPIWQIRYFSVKDHITTVHYGSDGNKTFEFYTPIGKLENRIFNKGFIRVHKSYIVSLRYLKSISTYSGAILEDGTVVPVGRAYYNSAKNTFDEIKEHVFP